MPWSAEDDRDLLLSISTEVQLTNASWDSIVARMTERGHNYTLSACKQHLQKLRKDAGNPSGKNSPNARVTKPKAVKAKGPAVGKKRKGAAQIDNDNVDDDEIWDAPAKKPKKEVIKSEENDGGLDETRIGAFTVESFDENGRQVVDLENDDLYYDANEV